MPKNLILAICSLTFFLAIAEIALRGLKFHVNQTAGYLKFACFNFVSDRYTIPIGTYDPYLFWRFKEKGDFREGRHSLSKPKNIYRIICMGDSTTQGFMLLPAYVTVEQTYPYQLNEILNKNISTIHFEVINAGCGGYSSFQGLRYLESELLAYNPDLLIIWFGINDSARAMLYSDKEQRPTSKIILRSRNLLDHSKFYQFYRQCLFYLLRKWPDHKPRVSASDFGANLEAMAKLAKGNNIKVLFIVPFEVVDSKVVSWFDSPNQYSKIFNDFQKEKIPVLNLAGTFQRLTDAYRYFSDSCHPRPKGNAIIADAVYKALVENKIIPVTANGDN
ncbi:MAG: SGNH/GDSL hydrolase family protein [Deltaproteobacteria bacterium]